MIKSLFMIKILQKMGPFNIVKAIHDKPTIKNFLNGENLRAFPLRSGIRQGCLL